MFRMKNKTSRSDLKAFDAFYVRWKVYEDIQLVLVRERDKTHKSNSAELLFVCCVGPSTRCQQQPQQSAVIVKTIRSLLKSY